MKERILLVLAFALTLAPGCATSGTDATMSTTAPSSDPTPISTPAAVAEPRTAPAPALPRAPAGGCQARIGADKLRRSAIKRSVDAGLGRWLQTVSIDPLLAHGRFRGWIIRSLDPTDACYAGIDLLAGDVVTRINGRSIEHPEEALEIWSALPASRELVVDFLRDGEARTLRLGIVDQ